jgi:excisionase family DNA binding protein
MSIQSTGLGDDEALVVTPRTACRLLCIGMTRLYELIGSGDLESYRDGASRRITTRSIKAFVEARLAASADKAA